jgi:hypothetical protein
MEECIMDNTPKHIIAVSAYVTNDNGEALLVNTHWRSDTWEVNPYNSMGRLF